MKRSVLPALLFALLPTLAPAADWPVRDLAVLEDPGGRETISTVRQAGPAQAFQPLHGGLSAGYTRGVHWLRFTLAAPPPGANGERVLLLEFAPPYLDDLRVFVPDRAAATGFDETRFSDRLPFASRAYPYRSFMQRIAFADAEPLTVYVRLQTRSSSVLVVRALQPADFVAHVTDEYALLGVFAGLLVAGLVSNLAFGAGSRDPLFRPFVLFLSATLLLLAGINGLHAQYLLPRSPAFADLWVPLSVVLMVLAGTHFYRKALAIDGASRWMQWVFRGVSGLAVLCLPTPFIGIYTEAALALMYAALVMMLVGLWRGMQLWRRRTGSGLVVLALVLSLSGSLGTALTLVGVLPGHFWLIYGTQLGSLGTLASLQLLIARRARALAAQSADVRAAARLAEAVADSEREARHTQQRLLSMLTHELKTPLSVIRMRLGTQEPSPQMRAHADGAVDEIAGLIDRCELAERLGNERLTPRREACALDALLRELVRQRDPGGRVRLALPEGSLATTDPVLLRAAVSNLIDNAMKYAPAAAIIDVAVMDRPRETRPGWCVRVANPPGPAGRPDPSRVFERYYRAPGAHVQSGSGLGLYIVQGLATLLGGELRYRSGLPQIVFELWLPR